ncbi:MAG: transcriptional repressor [Chloroflexota bacterium]|nr:transcriptional repressor [Chloroflexota bacterium]
MQKDILPVLKRYGYKLTPQRRAVISAIAGSSNHVTPAELCERARSEHPKVSLVTVYRTLKILSDLGLICEMHTEGISHSYLLRRPDEHHHHIVCSDCGLVVDFTECDLSGLERQLSSETGFEMEHHLLEFIGRCPGCRR